MSKYLVAQKMCCNCLEYAIKKSISKNMGPVTYCNVSLSFGQRKIKKATNDPQTAKYSNYMPVTGSV